MKAGSWRIAEIAKQHPERSLNSIHHHLDLDWLRVAYGRLKKDKAPGYDGQTVRDYGNDLDRRLTDLLARVKGQLLCAAGEASTHSERRGQRDSPDRNPDNRR